MDANAGYVIVGYLLTTLALGRYTLRLFARARAAGAGPRGGRTTAPRIAVKRRLRGRVTSTRRPPSPARSALSLPALDAERRRIQVRLEHLDRLARPVDPSRRITPRKNRASG